MNDVNCYHIACNSDEFCSPIRSQKEDASKHVSLVLVMPVLPDETWEDVLSDNFDAQNKAMDQLNREMITRVLNNDRLNFNDNYINDMLMDETTYGNDYAFKKVECEVGIDTMCASNEECVQLVPKSRSGICKCKEGFTLMDEICAPVNYKEDYVASRLTDKIISTNNSAKDVVSNKKQLTVSVRSKEVIS